MLHVIFNYYFRKSHEICGQAFETCCAGLLFVGHLLCGYFLFVYREELKFFEQNEKRFLGKSLKPSRSYFYNKHFPRVKGYSQVYLAVAKITNDIEKKLQCGVCYIFNQDKKVDRNDYD